MRAKDTNLLEFLSNPRQFVIPLYQRKYSWGSEQCENLWQDIIEAGKSETDSCHFFGSIVYMAENEFHDSPLLIIDGQQRLTTITLLLIALRRIVGDDALVDGFSASQIYNYYLVRSAEKGEKANRLLLTDEDRETLLALVHDKELPFNSSYVVEENFKWFEKELTKADREVKGQVCRGLTKLRIVDISLFPGQDNPQLVFESMNSKGLELTQADLIRNYVLMGLEVSEQEKLYRESWRPMEKIFRSKTKLFDPFVKHYLTVKNGSIPKESKLYEAFKEYKKKLFDREEIEQIVAEMYRFARYYAAMAMGEEKSLALKQAFFDLGELKIEVIYPFLLCLYERYAREGLSEDDFLTCLHFVEAYIFRRTVVGVGTNAITQLFASLGDDIQKGDEVGSLKRIFLDLKGKKYFPTDLIFKEAFKTQDLYGSSKIRKYWLRKLENYGRKELVNTDNYSVEHIMPQTLTESWEEALGDNYAMIHEELLNTAGNLTLTGYNSEYSNEDFIVKRDLEDKNKEKRGFEYSPLRLNEGLRNLDTWNGDEIKERSRILADKATRVWSLS